MLSAKQYARKLAVKARRAGLALRSVGHGKRVEFLSELAKILRAGESKLIAANRLDIREGKKVGLSAALIDRLLLTPNRIRAIAESLLEISRLPDPLGKILKENLRQNGLKIQQLTVPIGSILFIFESRPNVVIDGAALCVKSGNSVILRGGKESKRSNAALGNFIEAALTQTDLPVDAVQLVSNSDKAIVSALLQDSEHLDLVIPRGGERLIRAVADQSRIPVIKHYKGLCHLYWDASARYEPSLQIAVNAKTHRPGVCNAMETLLLDSRLVKGQVIKILDKLKQERVELRGCPRTKKIYPKIEKATPADWDEEYLDLRLSVKIVDGVHGAVEHIRRHGSGHTDGVLAESKTVQNYFLNNLDSASLMVNASTRFADGGQYGLGAEVGISTDKIHARGPMGIESLTTYQWRVLGSGQIRS